MGTDKKPWWVAADDTRVGVLVKNRRKKIVTLIIFLLVAVFVFVSLNANPGRGETVGPGGQIIAAPTMAQLGQGCGGIMSWPSAPADEIGYLKEGDFAFRVAPAVSGNFSKPWTGATFTETKVKIEEALALEYRGWVVIWYRADADTNALNSLKALHAKLPKDAKVLIAPWPLDANTTWRKGRVIILTGWNTTEPCLTVNTEVLDQFRKAMKEAPEPTLPLTENGPEAKASTYLRQIEEMQAKDAKTTK